MSSDLFMEFLHNQNRRLDLDAALKREQTLDSPAGAGMTLGGRLLVNLASSDYLGLANHPVVKDAAAAALQKYGVGLASTRLITGTLPIHLALEKTIAQWLGTDDAVVFASGYQANTGLFEALLGERDFIFCDELIRPSLADGIRLSRARVYTYRNRDLAHLQDRLRRSRTARFRIIATDGVFPLDGGPAPLEEIYRLAEQYDALVAVDDSHGIGVWGASGRGTHVELSVTAKPHVITGTFGHALGGGSGGFIACPSVMATWLRQRSRPYLTSTALPPASAAAALKAIELAKQADKSREALMEKVRAFRLALERHGFHLLPGKHPAIAIHVGHATVAQKMTDLLYQKGAYALGFCHPVVPEGSARIRAQVTIGHTDVMLENTAAAFAEAAHAAGAPLFATPT
ncbi:MAG: aminotransferase class I/II-fold pyridoxal phosphate-dependent enzyme [Deltaproteobacteria bacterium]|nr:aminotransferase class I/II-fold pyridoxal phosphate-dependent enzyme [Deltaproteobacteria bacterium]